mgnify:CR=1 FL=1
MEKRTTIQIENKTLKKFLKLKKYPRETNNEVLMRLIKQEIENNAVNSSQLKTKEELDEDNNKKAVETSDTLNNLNNERRKHGN